MKKSMKQEFEKKETEKKMLIIFAFESFASPKRHVI